MPIKSTIINDKIMLQITGQVQCLIICKSGGGKTLALEGIAEQLNKNAADTQNTTTPRDAATIIDLNDIKDENEMGYAAFQPREKYHIALLQKYNKPSSSKRVKIYHPFTFNLPKNKKLPPYTLFTIPLANLTTDELSIIAETSRETDTIRILKTATSTLKTNEDLTILAHKIQDSITKKSTTQNKDELMLDQQTRANLRDVGEIAQYLRPFLTDYYLAPTNSPLTLNTKNIINDPTHYHVLITKHLTKDKKTKDLAKICFFLEIMRNIEHAQRPIVFIWKEIASLCPYRTEGYKEYLSRIISDNLITQRSKGRGISSLMDAQLYNAINENVRSRSTEIFFGKFGDPKDFESTSKQLLWKRDTATRIQHLQENRFVLKDDENDTEYELWTPSHMHAEEKYNYEEMYEQHYPETMTTYNDIIQTMQKIKDENTEHIKAKIRRKQEQEQAAERAKQAQIEKQKKEEEQEQEQKEQKVVQNAQVKKQQMSHLLTIINEHPEYSNRQLGSIIGVHHSTIKKWLNMIDQNGGEIP